MLSVFSQKYNEPLISNQSDEQKHNNPLISDQSNEILNTI